MANAVTKTVTDVVSGDTISYSFCTFDTEDSALTIAAATEGVRHYLLGFGYGITQAHTLIVKSDSDTIWRASHNTGIASKDGPTGGALAMTDAGDALTLEISDMTVSTEYITVIHTTSSLLAFGR